jgi:O-antigen ligase
VFMGLISKKIYIDIFIVIFLLLSISILIPTLLNNGDLKLFSIYYGLPLGYFFLIQIYKKNILVLIRTTDNVLKALILINFITVLLYPNGLYSEGRWILGLSNVHIMYIIFSMFISIYRSIYTNKVVSISTKIYLLLCYVSLLLVWSATSLVAVSVLILMLINYKTLFKFRKIVNIFSYAFISILFFILLVFFRINNYFVYFFEFVLRKDATLTLRTFIWDEVIELIGKNNYMGMGLSSPLSMLSNFGYVHSHSYYLELLRVGGLISLVLFIILIISLYIKKRSHNNQALFILSMFVLPILILFQTEVYIYMTPIYSILYLIYNFQINSYEVQHKCKN